MDKIIRITPSFAVAGALEEADFAEIAKLGFRSVINNRVEDEEEGQIATRQENALSWRAGLTYRHVPAAKHDLFTDEVVCAMADALATLEGPVLAHCKSGMRSAIIWAAAAARDEPVAGVLAALGAAGFDLDFLQDELEQQADRKNWASRTNASAAGAQAPAAEAA